MEVAPYGIANMPAVYSRAMMHVLRGLQDVPLGYFERSKGSGADPNQNLGTT